MPSLKTKTLVRIIAMVQLIPRHPRGVTARWLWETLKNRGYEITKRTVERDLVEIADIFGLTTDESSQGYKWSFSRDDSLCFLPSLSPNEALSLQLVEKHLKNHLPASVYNNLQGIFCKSKSTLQKSSLLNTWPQKIATVSQGLSISSVNIDEKIQHDIYQGVLEQKWLEITYKDSQKKLPVKPLGLLIRDKKLVLVCSFYDYSDYRTILLHRIKSVKVFDETFETTFKITEYLKSNEHAVLLVDNLITLTLEVKGYVKQMLAEAVINDTQQLIAKDDVWSTFTIEIMHTIELENWLQSYAQDIRIQAPQLIKTNITTRLLAALENINI